MMNNFKRIDIAGPVQDLVKELHLQEPHHVEIYAGFQGSLQIINVPAEDARVVDAFEA